MSGETCSECQGHGYDVFHVDREPGKELERCDSCQRWDDDDAAAVAFVRDLERGEPWARRCVGELVS